MSILLLLLFALCVTPLRAQHWEAPAARALVSRAVERRAAQRSDTALTSYRARAEGFVFFSTQVGEGLTEPPRLIKADQLVAEVYWRTPGLSKQVIQAWRDRRYLPTDISYHRDHLMVVHGNLPDRITVGAGDEVRGVVHPFARDGPSRYEYAIGDSISLGMADQVLRLLAVDFRPRDPQAGLAVGRAYLDAASGDIVRLRLGFTASAYRDDTVEDITFILENVLQDGRFWLPFRQEVEIRRRVSWLDFPARTVIRVRWSLDRLEANPALDPGLFRGPQLSGLPAPVDSGGPWAEPIEEAAEAAARPLSEQDLESARVEIQRLVGGRALHTLQGARLGTNSVSDLVLVNRVNGLRLGVGGTLGRGTVEARAWLGYGTSDGRVLGSLSAGSAVGAAMVSARLYRKVLLSGLLGQVRVPLSGRLSATVGLGVEESETVAVSASPVHGAYRPNPSLGAGTYGRAWLALRRGDGGVGLAQDVYGTIRLESGYGTTSYLRATAQGTGTVALGFGTVLARAYLGWGSEGLPAYRSFVMGGRQTLPGEPFREWGGRSLALFHIELRTAVPIPAIDLGTFASTGDRLMVAPFVAAGWADRAIAGTPWQASGGFRPVAGLGFEWLMSMVRLELGVGLLDGGVQVTFDVTRGWWPLL
jgi:hypothetical protein